MAQYTEQQRIEALAQLELNGGNLKRTARNLNLPPATLRHWRDDTLDAMGDNAALSLMVPQKPDFVARLENVLNMLVDKIEAMVPDADNIRDTAVVFGIMADKHLDYRDGRKGGVSVNVDNRSINLPQDLSVDELRRLASGDDE